MKKLEFVHSLGNIKLLADARRMNILRILMASPATLTQLARILQRSPAWIRHHILALETAGFIEVGEVRKTGKVTEKFYRAKAEALLLQEIVLPKTKKPALIFSGSDDFAVEAMAAHLQKRVTLLSLSVGSLDGLVNLRQGLCQISGSHLLDESGDYNRSFIRHLFPDREMQVITLANRTQGLMLAKANPRGVRGISDLTNSGVRFVNRNPGSGTRLWLDRELSRLAIPAEKLHGYNKVVKTHVEAAGLIATDGADAAVGLQAAALHSGLQFLPLFEERYDLVFPRENERMLLPVLECLQTSGFRARLNELIGYNTAHTGEEIRL